VGLLGNWLPVIEHARASGPEEEIRNV
jgi:hypothetical protein